MPRLLNLVKGNPLATKAGKCICGLRLKAGLCRHCDSFCDKILRDPNGCNRCVKNVKNFVHKDLVRDEYFALIDEDLEVELDKIRAQSFLNNLPDFLKPDEGN